MMLKIPNQCFVLRNNLKTKHCAFLHLFSGIRKKKLLSKVTSISKEGMESVLYFSFSLLTEVLIFIALFFTCEVPREHKLCKTNSE